MPVDQCHLVDFPRINDPRGNLTVIEGMNHIPFEIRRVYYLYDVPSGLGRGGHAHKNLHQILIATSGSFEVTISDGHDKKSFELNQSYKGLYICPMIWRELYNFSRDAVCFVLASEIYDEADYIRNIGEFECLVGKKGHD